MKDKKLIIIPFSAGVDSTYIVLKTLRELYTNWRDSAKNMLGDIPDVRLTFVKSGNNPQTPYAQPKVRAIYEALRSYYYEMGVMAQKIQLVENEITFGVKEYTQFTWRWHGVTALPLVISGILGAIDTQNYNKIDILLGYHQGDDPLKIRGMVESAINGLTPLINMQPKDEGSQPADIQIHFPLEGNTKVDNLDGLIREIQYAGSIQDVIEKNVMTCVHYIENKVQEMECYLILSRITNVIAEQHMCNSCYALLQAAKELYSRQINDTKKDILLDLLSRGSRQQKEYIARWLASAVEETSDELRETRVLPNHMVYN